MKVDSQQSLQVTRGSVEMRSQFDKRKAALRHTETNRTRKNIFSVSNKIGTVKRSNAVSGRPRSVISDHVIGWVSLFDSGSETTPHQGKQN